MSGKGGPQTSGQWVDSLVEGTLTTGVIETKRTRSSSTPYTGWCLLLYVKCKTIKLKEDNLGDIFVTGSTNWKTNRMDKYTQH